MTDNNIYNDEWLISLPTHSTKPITGIYFLFRGNKLLYIGQSTDIEQRIQQHRQNKVFDSYRVFECPPHQLLRREKTLIKQFRPPLNIAHQESTILPVEFETKEFKSFYSRMNEYTAMMFGNYFICKLPNRMVWSFLLSRKVRGGYHKYKFKQLKGEFITNGSVMINKATGWFKSGEHTYYLEPKGFYWKIIN